VEVTSWTGGTLISWRGRKERYYNTFKGVEEANIREKRKSQDSVRGIAGKRKST